MGSVIDYIECPNCSEEAFMELYYKTGEEFTFCPKCGYTKEISLKNRDKALDELTAEDWNVKENKNPVGVYNVKEYGRVSSVCGSFDNVLDMERMKNDVLENSEGVELFTITRYVDGKHISETIIDNGPETDGAGFTHQENEL